MPGAACSTISSASFSVCVETPRSLGAVGQWYADFSPTTDDEVARILAAAAAPRG